MMYYILRPNNHTHNGPSRYSCAAENGPLMDQLQSLLGRGRSGPCNKLEFDWQSFSRGHFKNMKMENDVNEEVDGYQRIIASLSQQRLQWIQDVLVHHPSDCRLNTRAAGHLVQNRISDDPCWQDQRNVRSQP